MRNAFVYHDAFIGSFFMYAYKISMHILVKNIGFFCLVGMSKGLVMVIFGVFKSFPNNCRNNQNINLITYNVARNSTFFLYEENL